MCPGPIVGTCARRKVRTLDQLQGWHQRFASPAPRRCGRTPLFRAVCHEVDSTQTSTLQLWWAPSYQPTSHERVTLPVFTWGDASRACRRSCRFGARARPGFLSKAAASQGLPFPRKRCAFVSTTAQNVRLQRFAQLGVFVGGLKRKIQDIPLNFYGHECQLSHGT